MIETIVGIVVVLGATALAYYFHRKALHVAFQQGWDAASQVQHVEQSDQQERRPV